MTVRRFFASIFNGRNRDVTSVVDVDSARLEEVSAVAVGPEEAAAADAAAFSGNFWRNFGQSWRPQEPESVCFSVVFLNVEKAEKKINRATVYLPNISAT